jgi:hypothetical protein
MKKTEVPQDSENSTYGGVRKLIYATNDDGDYEGVKSAGWEVEADATRSALQLIAQQCDDAWQRAQQGLTAPLEYYMYYRRMDLALLSQTTGLFQWRIRRHLKPAVFQRLSAKLLARYSEALGISPEQLQQLPPSPLHEPTLHESNTAS